VHHLLGLQGRLGWRWDFSGLSQSPLGSEKGRCGNPGGRPKNPLEFAPNTDDPGRADRRTVGNLVIEARKFSGLAVDTLVDLTKDNHTDSTRFNAATALLDRGYGRPAQSLDLHLSADAITKRLSDMTDAELAALERRMIAAAPIPASLALEASAGADNAEGVKWCCEMYFVV
jgi:hypothetical protein